MTTYCETSDLLIGQIPMPASLDPQRFVQDATDEVDSYVGLVYQTPVDVTPSSTVPRPIRLLLKRITVHMATGRLILAAAAGSQDKQLNAYGEYLVKQACEALEKIANGSMPLLGLPTLEVDGNLGSLPMIAQQDAESNVSAFYDRVLQYTVNPDASGRPYTWVNNWYIPY